MEQYLDRALVLRTLRYTTIQPPADDNIIALTLQTARDRVEKLPTVSLKNARSVAHWIYCGDDNTIECEECTPLISCHLMRMLQIFRTVRIAEILWTCSM